MAFEWFWKLVGRLRKGTAESSPIVPFSGIAHGSVVAVPRKLRGKHVALVFLDLSTSMSRIADHVAAGYQRLGALPPTLWVILCGFNRDVFLLYEGPAAHLPDLQAAHFSFDTKESLLSRGTALHRAICIAAELTADLQAAAAASVTWITDGENTEPPGEDEAVAAIEHIREAGISFLLQGIRPPGQGPGPLAAMIARLDSHTMAEDAPVSDPEGGFHNATDRILDTLPKETDGTTERD